MHAAGENFKKDSKLRNSLGMPARKKQRQLAKVPKKRGPKPAVVDRDLAERLASIACTTDEIGAVMGYSRDTIEKHALEYVQRGRLKMKASIRRMQWKACEAGNVTMLIWMGKQYLAQTERTTVSGPDGGPIQMQSVPFDIGQFLDDIVSRAKLVEGEREE